MATSQITLYYVPSEIHHDGDNRIIENWGDCLFYDVNNIFNERAFLYSQYQKIDLEMEVKVVLDQAEGKPLANPAYSDSYNYCVISDSIDTRKYFFFIEKMDWRGESCILLKLKMDYLNVFFQTVRTRDDWNSDASYFFSNRSHITREHQVRYITSGNAYIPVINYFPEGINPVLYKSSDETIDHEEYTDENNNHYTSSIRWNLMYVTNNDDNSDLKANPLKVYLIPNEKVRLYQASSANESVPMDLLDPDKIYIKPNGTATIDGLMISPSSTQYSFIYYDANDGWKLVFTNGLNSGNADSITLSAGKVTMSGIQKFGTFLVSSSAGKYILNQANLTLKMTAAANLFSIIEDFFFIGSNSNIKYLIGLNEFDLTDSKIVKLIACPYCPIPVYQDSENLEIEGNVEYACGRLLVKNKQFENHLEYTNIVRPDTYVRNNIYGMVNISPTDERQRETDPKLFSSEFFTYKFVYDSFAKEIPLENLEQEMDDYALSITYKQTSTINSKFAFKFDELSFLRTNEDYPEYLVCARNNERTIYSNSYINYLRTGYNYDVKNKEAKNAMNWINFGIGTLSTVASTGASVATGNAFMAASAVRTAFSTASSIINNIHQSSQAERDLRQKQDALKQQSLSVSGSDDIDLLEFYNDNRLHIMTYAPNQYAKQMLEDLFYYFGYATNEYKVPEVNNRYWFNFVKGEIVINEVEFCQWSILLDAVKEAFAEGVTIMHAVPEDNSSHPAFPYVYDFSQHYANWETEIL